MKRKILAVALVVGLLAFLSPAPRAFADGAASTRNILMGLGAAAATLIIINHNKQVHQRYAQDAANQAALAAQRNNAQAAYKAEVQAYNHEVAVAESYKKEVSVKDQMIADQAAMIKQQRAQLAQLGVASQPVAVAPAAAQAPVKRGSRQAAPHTVVAYGWGVF
jgi:hypothetical protein